MRSGVAPPDKGQRGAARVAALCKTQHQWEMPETRGQEAYLQRKIKDQERRTRGFTACASDARTLSTTGSERV